jgi:hypothetical protein
MRLRAAERAVIVGIGGPWEEVKNLLEQTQRWVERERTHEDKNLGIRVLRRGLIVLTLTLQGVVLADEVIQSLRVFFCSPAG